MEVRSEVTSKAQNVLKTTAPFCPPLPPPPPPYLLSFPPVLPKWITSPLTGSEGGIFSELGKNLY